MKNKQIEGIVELSRNTFEIHEKSNKVDGIE
jgi:hypothetical protein